jgi:hypothetical protein
MARSWSPDELLYRTSSRDAFRRHYSPTQDGIRAAAGSVAARRLVSCGRAARAPLTDCIHHRSKAVLRMIQRHARGWDGSGRLWHLLVLDAANAERERQRGVRPRPRGRIHAGAVQNRTVRRPHLTGRLRGSSGRPTVVPRAEHGPPGCSAAEGPLSSPAFRPCRSAHPHEVLSREEGADRRRRDGWSEPPTSARSRPGVAWHRKCIVRWRTIE